MKAPLLACEVHRAVEDGLETSFVKALVIDLLNEYERYPGRPVQLHPLGFLVLSWDLGEDKVLRLHYWSDRFGWGQSSDLHVHDHVFGFVSAVLLGALRNITYEVSPSESGDELYITRYVGGVSQLVQQDQRMAIVREDHNVIGVGDSYRVERGVFHKTILECSSAITILATRYEHGVRDGARVLGRGGNSVENFDRAALRQIDVHALIQEIGQLLRTC